MIYKSGITGEAEVRFGGKICLEMGYFKDQPEVLSIGISEYKKTYKVGEIVEQNADHYPVQVALTFPDLESLHNFRGILDLLEDSYKEKLEEIR